MPCFQEEQYRICLNTFPETSMMFMVNFAENYTFQEYNEVQEMHWHSFQLIVLVHICYQWNPKYLVDLDSGTEKLITKYHYYLFDNIKHNTLFVQHYFELHWAHLIGCGLFPNKHII